MPSVYANQDCPSGQKCVATEGGGYCREAQCEGCSDDEMCLRGACVRRCASTQDCADEEVCTVGIGGSDPAVCSPGPCQTHRGETHECDDAEICFEDRGGCQLPCNSDSECIERYDCEDCTLGGLGRYCRHRQCDSQLREE